MTALFELFKDETFRFWYTLVGAGLMTVPMIGLAWWYHSNIGKSQGGRALMQRQKAVGPYARELAAGLSMARDIRRGKYGTEARTMQKRVNQVIFIWIAVLVIYFGLLIWADEVNKVVPVPG